MACKYYRDVLGGEEDCNMYFRTQHKSDLRSSNHSLSSTEEKHVSTIVRAPIPLKIKDSINNTQMSLLSESDTEDFLALSGEDSPEADLGRINNPNSTKWNILTEEDLETIELQEIFTTDPYNRNSASSPGYELDDNSDPAEWIAFYTQGRVSPPNPRKDCFGGSSSDDCFLPQLGYSPANLDDTPKILSTNRSPPSRAHNPLEKVDDSLFAKIHLDDDHIVDVKQPFGFKLNSGLDFCASTRNRRYSAPISWVPIRPTSIGF